MMNQKWENVYTHKFGGTWYPSEGIVKFIARYVQRKVGIDAYDIKKKVNRVIDIGCGNGRHIVFFAEQGFDVCGIDISEEAIKIAQAWLFKKGLKGDLKVGDIEKFNFQDKCFDLVIVYGVLDHIPFSKAKKVMKEIRRICAPNAYVYVTLRSTKDSEFERGGKIEDNTFTLQEGYEKGIMQHYFDLGQIKELFKEFNIFDIEMHEEKFPGVFGVDKAFLQSSKGVKRYIDFSKDIDMDLRYSRWHITAERSE